MCEKINKDEKRTGKVIIIIISCGHDG